MDKTREQFRSVLYCRGNFTVLYKNRYNSIIIICLYQCLSNQLNDFQAAWWHFMPSATRDHITFAISVP